MQIHISRDGQSYGPYSAEEIHHYLSTGHLRSTDLAWHEGMAEWKSLDTLPGFENSAVPVPPVIPFTSEPSAYHHVALWKFVIFSLCSFGLYNLYWFYKNWKSIRNRDSISISPFWRTVFAPIWCYSLAKDVSDAKSDSNPAVPALVAVSYVALYITHRLPDPYWLISLFSFVPLLVVARQIDQINRERNTPASYFSRIKIRHIIACLFGALLLLFTISATLNLIPNTQVVSGDRMSTGQMQFLKQADIIRESESVLYFYSTGMFSIEDDGNLITTERVVSYERDIDSDLIIYSAEYKEIKDIEVTYSDSFVDDTIVRIELTDEDEFYLVLSTEEKRDKLFVNKLMELWKQHQTNN